ncbi:MAG: type II secretion system minor pseudopilin GspI [Rudaea sp.]
MNASKHRGFTLLEVLVALLVLALALLALSRTAASQVDVFGALRERTVAGWLAADVLAQTRLATPFPATGTSDGRRRFGGREWRYDIVVQATPVASIRRIDVHVYAPDDPKSPLATLTGFGGQDLLP